MLKKTIKYTDFNDEEVSEDFFFHLSKAELVEMEMDHEGGLSETLTRIVAAKDAKSIIAEFKKIILGAYGQKSEDGRRFIKNQQLRDEFESTEAYSVLFMELVTDTDAAIEFINGIIPTGLAAEAAKVVDTDTRALAAVADDADRKGKVEEKPQPRIVTKFEMEAMTAEERADLWPKITSGEVRVAD